MKAGKIILTIALVALTLLFLVACGGTSTEENKIAAEEFKDYTIITSGSGASKSAAELFNQRLEENYGVKLEIKTDAEAPSGKEIVFGNANRDFVSKVYAKDSYKVAFSDRNLFINGGSRESMVEAVEILCGYFFDEGLDMTDKEISKETQYKLGGLILNGEYIGNYKIYLSGKTYGCVHAANYLQKQLEELTGEKLSIVTEHAEIGFYISDENNDKGLCEIEPNGTKISLFGAGMGGQKQAVDALIAEIGEKKNVELLDYVSKPAFTLPNSAARLAEGELTIGFLGDSVPAFRPEVVSLTTYFLEFIKEEYPNADIKMKNESQGGCTTTWGLYRLERELLEMGYCDLIFITLGTNDSPYGANYEESAINYQSMIEKIRRFNPNAEVVFLMYGRDNEIKKMVNGQPVAFMQAMLDVGAYYNVPVVDTTFKLSSLWINQSAWDFYMNDTVHPNSRGEKLYAQILWQSVKAGLAGADAENAGACYMPSEPLFEGGKINATLYPQSEINATYADGWGEDGVASVLGSTMSFDFEGIGFEIQIALNQTNASAIKIEVFDENGANVLTKFYDTYYKKHFFVTNKLPLGKYTVKLTNNAQSSSTPSENPTVTLTDIMIIADPSK